MSARNGDTVMQDEVVEEEEELALGQEKLIVVGSIFAERASSFSLSHVLWLQDS